MRRRLNRICPPVNSLKAPPAQKLAIKGERLPGKLQTSPAPAQVGVSSKGPKYEEKIGKIGERGSLLERIRKIAFFERRTTREAQVSREGGVKAWESRRWMDRGSADRLTKSEEMSIWGGFLYRDDNHFSGNKRREKKSPNHNLTGC